MIQPSQNALLVIDVQREFLTDSTRDRVSKIQKLTESGKYDYCILTYYKNTLQSPSYSRLHWYHAMDACADSLLIHPPAGLLTVVQKKRPKPSPRSLSDLGGCAPTSTWWALTRTLVRRRPPTSFTPGRLRRSGRLLRIHQRVGHHRPGCKSSSWLPVPDRPGLNRRWPRLHHFHP